MQAGSYRTRRGRAAAWRDGMREAASDVCSIARERAATTQTARKAAARPGFDDMAPSAVLLALRICTSYSTRLAPSIRGHLVRNTAHEGSCIGLPRRNSRNPARCARAGAGATRALDRFAD